MARGVSEPHRADAALSRRVDRPRARRARLRRPPERGGERRSAASSARQRLPRPSARHSLRFSTTRPPKPTRRASAPTEKSSPPSGPNAIATPSGTEFATARSATSGPTRSSTRSRLKREISGRRASGSARATRRCFQRSTRPVCSAGVARWKTSRASAARTTHGRSISIRRKGVLQAGSDADLFVFDPDATRVTRAAELESASGYTIYEGEELGGWPELVLLRGEAIVEDGGAGRAKRGWSPHPCIGCKPSGIPDADETCGIAHMRAVSPVPGRSGEGRPLPQRAG